MKKVYFATRNKGKVDSLRSFLSKYGIEVIQVPFSIREPRTDDLEEIARQKVLTAYEKIGKACIALDSGFYIHSLNGFPKTYVNFVLKTIGIEGILKLVEGKERKCEFRNCLAYMDDSLEEPKFFKLKVRGSLSEGPRVK